MSKNRAAWLLLTLVLPVWAVGFYHSLDMRREQIRPRDGDRWLKRYAALRPHLKGSPKATIVYGPTRRSQGNKRLFRAQYALAPTIVSLPRKRQEGPPVRPRKLPLIYDHHTRSSLDKALKPLAAQARRRGVAMRTEIVARGLAVVWLTEE